MLKHQPVSMNPQWPYILLKSVRRASSCVRDPSDAYTTWPIEKTQKRKKEKEKKRGFTSVQWTPQPQDKIS